MKSGVTNSLKFKRLKRLLQQPDCMVAGVLEMLWGLAVDQARMGDVGRFSDEEIAASIDWPGNAAELIAALVESGWLDPNPVCRLLVHDWIDHAPQFVMRWIARQFGIEKVETERLKELWLARFAIGGSCLAKTASEQDLASQTGVGALPYARGSIPFHSNPCKSIDRLDRPTELASYETTEVSPEAWEAALPELTAAKQTLAGDRPLAKRNRETVMRGVLVARHYLPPGTVAGVLEAMRDGLRRERIHQPFAYFRKSIIKACTLAGVDYHRAEAALVVPERAHPPPARASP